MTVYEYRVETIRDAMYLPDVGSGIPDDAPTIDLPDDAVGVTVDTFGDDVWVRYLVPVDGGGVGGP